ncbi:MAG: DUF5666 domain-containing protein, partial [Gammaproteobacteria bacterium]|nr:DUF5666 domain-containing protein [Gammaproteobacteria bacterium]
MRYPGLAFLLVLGACSSGDINFPAVNPVIGPGLPGSIQITETSYDGTEGTVVNILVARSGGSSGIVTVDYATADGTAVGGSDYTAANGTLSWPNGTSGNRTISIPITDDNSVEGPESFTVTLSNVSRATLGANSSASVNIIDNDTAALSAFGAVTALNDVTVNGIRYETNSTNVYVNGHPANVSDLKLGQTVAIDGEVNFSNATGTADEIRYFASVIGPVENTDATTRRLIVMGQTVWTDADTVFGPSIDPETFAGLTLGAVTQISGFLNEDGDIMATRIDLDITNTELQLIGNVAGLDLANLLFTFNGLTVDYSGAILIDVPGGAPSNGMMVRAIGTTSGGLFVVERLQAQATVENAIVQ